MAKAINADIVDASKAIDISGYGLIGFGSGIYAFKHHAALLKLADSIDGKGKKAFVFSTSGTGEKKYHSNLIKKLKQRGFEIKGEFSCKGLDKFGPLALFGGINKGKPDKEDIKKAEEFAKSLVKK